MDLTTQCDELLRETETFQKENEQTWSDLPEILQEEMKTFKEGVRSIQEEIFSSPRIGLVGQVSAGKTRMLEIFLGNVGGILSTTGVGAGATTGNIVEFNITKGDNDQTTFDSWKIQIMGEEHIDSLFSQFIEEVEKRADKNDVQHNALLEKLKELNNNVTQMSKTDYWSELNKWTVEAYNQDSIKTIAPIALEMFRLSQCLNVTGKKWLGKILDVKEKQASWVMTLENCNQSPRCLEHRHLSFPDLKVDLENIEEETFRQFFPVIQKIQVNARLPQKLFTYLFEAQRSVQLIDCPGYGAHSSSIRDRALCFVEFEEIDLVLLLLDSKNPGHRTDFVTESKRRWGDLKRKQRTIVVLNKFDLLQIKGEEEQLRRVEAMEQIRENDVLEALGSSLQQPYTYALEQVSNINSVVFFSSSVFVGKMYYSADKLAFAVPEYLANQYANMNYEGSRTCQRWENFVQKMDDSPLASLLKDYSKDGGGGRLFKTIQKRVEEHGVSNQQNRHKDKLQKLTKRWESLRERISKAVERSQRSVELSEDSEIPTREQMNNVIKKFGENIERLRTRDSSPVTISFLKSLEKMREYFVISFVDHVNAWPIWDRIYRTIDESSEYCVSSQTENSELPLQTSFFIDMYNETLKDTVTRIVDREIPNRLEYAFENMDEDPKFQWNDDELKQLAGTFVFLHEKYGHSELPEDFIKSPSPSNMSTLFLGASKLKMEETLSQNGSCFPLQADGKPREFAWSPNISRESGQEFNDRNYRHITTILQIRQALCEGGEFCLSRLTQNGKLQFLGYMSKRCDELLEIIGKFKEQIAKLDVGHEEDEDDQVNYDEI